MITVKALNRYTHSEIKCLHDSVVNLRNNICKQYGKSVCQVFPKKDCTFHSLCSDLEKLADHLESIM